MVKDGATKKHDKKRGGGGYCSFYRGNTINFFFKPQKSTFGIHDYWAISHVVVEEGVGSAQEHVDLVLSWLVGVVRHSVGSVFVIHNLFFYG
jgi:hypothetical protein